MKKLGLNSSTLLWNRDPQHAARLYIRLLRMEAQDGSVDVNMARFLTHNDRRKEILLDEDTDKLIDAFFNYCEVGENNDGETFRELVKAAQIKPEKKKPRRKQPERDFNY